MQPSYLITAPTENASCMCLKLVLTSHKNICKIVKQKVAQKIHYIRYHYITLWQSLGCIQRFESCGPIKGQARVALFDKA